MHVSNNTHIHVSTDNTYTSQTRHMYDRNDVTYMTDMIPHMLVLYHIQFSNDATYITPLESHISATCM